MRKRLFIELAHEIQNQLMKDLEHSDFSGIKFQRELSKYDGKKFRYGIPFVYTSTLGMENENDNLFGEICYNITQTPSSVVGLPNPRETRCIVFKLGLFARDYLMKHR